MGSGLAAPCPPCLGKGNPFMSEGLEACEFLEKPSDQPGAQLGWSAGLRAEPAMGYVFKLDSEDGKQNMPRLVKEDRP